MTARSRPSSCWAIALSWGLLSPLLVAPCAWAQTMLGADPYRPYNSGYESFSLPPSSADNFAAINGARMQNYSARANQMGSFYDELYGAGNNPENPGDNARRGARPGSNYDSANRQFDRQYGRVYTPNAGDTFYSEQKKRTQDYFAALNEKDPKKREAMMRAVQQENLRASRSLSSKPKQPTVARPRTNRAPAATTPATGTTSRPRTSVNPAATPATTGTGSRASVPSSLAPLTTPSTRPTPPSAPASRLTTPSASTTRRPFTSRYAPPLSRPSTSSDPLNPSIRGFSSPSPSTPGRRPSQVLERALRSSASDPEDEPTAAGPRMDPGSPVPPR
jgi:hypothetical protein